MAKTKSKTAKSDVWYGKSDPAWDDGTAFPEISPKNGNEVVVGEGISPKNENEVVVGEGISPKNENEVVVGAEISPKNENEVVVGAEISQIQEDGQITLFYDSLDEPPEPDDFTSTEAYNQAYQDWQQKHPDLSNHGFTSNPEKPEIGTLCTIISKHKKYIGESGYVCAYHQDDSPEFWVKLAHHDLQLRCLPAQISISLKNHRGFAIGDSVVDLKNEGRTGTIKILRSNWLVASWDNQNEGIYYYEHILKIGSCIYSKTEQRSGVVVSIGRSGFSVEWQGWLKCAYSFAQIEELQLSKVEEIEPCDSSMSVQALGLDSALPVYKPDGNSPAHQKLTDTVPISSTSVITSITTEMLKTLPCMEDLDLNEEKSTLSQLPLPVPPSQSMVSDLGQQMKETVSPQSSNSLIDISPISPSSKTLLDCSPVPINQETQGCISVTSCNNFTEAGTMRNGFVSPAATLAPPSLENDYFWLPSPSALSSTGKGRPPGQNKQEAELKNLGLIARGEVLNPVILSDWYNLPQNWLDPSESSPAIQLLENRDRQQEIFSILESQQLPLPESTTWPQSPTLTPTIATTTTIKKQLYKALTVRQPHASLFGFHKGFETRNKATNYRGVILIHAAIEHDDTKYLYSTLADLLPPYEELVFGSIVAIADLTDCIKMTEEFINQQSETELRCGFWEVGRYAWKLENVVILPEPIPARGMPGMWDFELPITNYQLPITKPQFKTGEYILNGRVGEIIEVSPGEYFSVKYGNGYADLKCYFWGQDDELIDQLAIAPQELVEKFLRENLEIPTDRFAIAPQELVEKFLRENLEIPTDRFAIASQELDEKFLGENVAIAPQELDEKFLGENVAIAPQELDEKFLGENVAIAPQELDEKFLGENVAIAPQELDEKFLGENVAIAPQELVEKFLGENVAIAPQELDEKFLGENVAIAPQELDEKFLGENVAIAPQELVEKFLGENVAIAPQELDEKFLGENVAIAPQELDEKFLGENVAIAPQELVEKFLGENVAIASQELDEKFLGENVAIAPQELVEKFLGENVAIASQELDEKFLGENQHHNVNDSKDGDLEQLSLSPKKKIASGSLAPYLENKKLKDGTIATYPRVSGERDPLNHLHWRWGYYYEIKVDGEWKNRSLPVPARIVLQVKNLIENHCSVQEIKDFIVKIKGK